MNRKQNPNDQRAGEADVSRAPETVDMQQDSSRPAGRGLESEDLDVAEFAECIKLIDQVRAHNPDFMDDLLEGAPAPLEETSAVPKKIGRFRIREQIGSGSYGLVYRALDPELGRDVALKIPLMETMLRETDWERFLREAQTLSALAHPNIATVYEAGHAGPIYYMATAYYGGGTLAGCLTAHGLPHRRHAAQLVCRLAEAVEHAHQRGILHRDLKPANILFDTDGPGTSVDALNPASIRITDFGLAGFVDQDPQLTRTGAVIGTPAYMSPEQAEGRHTDISTASDVYALGAIFYELLTGRPPFQKDSLLASLEAVRSEEPVPPEKLVPGIPRDLSAVCLRCLEKSPAKRYPRAAELAGDLQRWLNGEPVAARPLSTSRRAARWCRRNPAWAALFAVVLFGTVTVAAVATSAYFRVKDARDQLARRNSDLVISRDAEARRARQLRESLDAQTSIVLEDLLSRQEELTDDHRKYLQTALASYDQFVHSEGNDQQAREGIADAYARVGRINIRLGQNDAAIAAFQESVAHYDALIEKSDASPDLEHRRAKVQTDWAQLLKDLEQLPQAEVRLREALESTRKLVAAFPARTEFRELLVGQLATLGNISKHMKHLPESRQLFQEAITAQQRIVAESGDAGPPRTTLARLHASLGQTLFFMQELDEAIRMMREGKRILEALVNQSPDRANYREELAGVLNGLAVTLARAKQTDEADAIFREIVEVRRELAERFPANVNHQVELVVAYNNLGVAMQRNGDHQEASRLWHAGEAVARRLVANYPDMPYHHYQLGSLLLHLAQLNADQRIAEPALHYVQEGAAELQVALDASPNHPLFKRAQAELFGVTAKVMSLAGRHDEAAAAAEELLAQPIDPVRSPLTAARVFSRCAATVKDSDPDRMRHYLDRGVISLQQAVENGLKDFAPVANEEDFQELRTREEVKRLMDAHADEQEHGEPPTP